MKKRQMLRLVAWCILASMVLPLSAFAAYADKGAGDFGLLFSEDFNGIYAMPGSPTEARASDTLPGSNLFRAVNGQNNVLYAGSNRGVVRTEPAFSDIDRAIKITHGAVFLETFYASNTVGATSLPVTYLKDNADASKDALAQEGKHTKVYTEFDMNLENYLDESNHAPIYIVLDNVIALRMEPVSKKIQRLTAGSVTGGTYVDVQAYELNKWYRMRFVTDVTGETAAAKTVSVYRDGELILENNPLVDTGAAVKDAYDKFYARINTKTGTLTTWYPGVAIDNFSLYKYSAQAVTDGKTTSGVPADVGRLLSLIRAGYDLQADNPGVLSAVTAGLAVYNDAKGKNASVHQASIDDACDALTSAIENASGPTYPEGGYQAQYDFDTTAPAAADGALISSADYDTGAALGTAGSVWKMDFSQSGGSNPYRVLGGSLEGIKINPSNDTNYPAIKAVEQEGPGASLITEYDIRFQDLVESRSRVRITMSDPDYVAVNFTTPVSLIFDGDAKKVAIANGANFSTLFTEDLADGKWYRVRHELNIVSAAGALLNTQTIWINGVRAFVNASFDTTNYWKCPVITEVRLTKLANTVTGLGTTMFLDNFSVYKANSNAGATMNTGRLLGGIRKAAGLTSLSEEDALLLGAAVTAAKSAYEDAQRTQETVDAAADALYDVLEWVAGAINIFEIDAVRLEDSDGDPAYEITDGGAVTGLYVSKVVDVPKGGKAIVGLYRDGALVNVAVAEIPDSMAANTTVAFPLYIELPPTGAALCTLKAFVWDGTTAMRPVAEPLRPAAQDEGQAITVYLAGDSMVQTYGPESAPQAGWGQTLPARFDSGKISVVNHAVGGRSSKSFIDEGRLGAILTAISPGDYLFVQFNHNDQKNDRPDLYTDPATTYQDYLTQYIKAVRAKGAIPVLVTSPPRYRWSGGVYTGVADLGAYAAAMKAVGERYGVAVIDLNTKWAAHVAGLGEEGSKALYLMDDAAGEQDRTHFNTAGANKAADFILDLLVQMKHPLSRHTVTP